MNAPAPQQPAAIAATTPDLPRSYFIALEGWPFIVLGLLVSAVGTLLALPVLFWLGVVWVALCAAFFRNPARAIPTAPGVVVSPADGRVLSVETVDEPFFGCGPMQRICIFLSVTNVHINRMPVAGVVQEVAYTPGRFRVAYAPEASFENERNAIWLRSTETNDNMVLVQIAGWVARRIICYVQRGNLVTRGMRCGLIRFGSRTDLYLPLTAHIAVRAGDRVAGGSSVLAQFVPQETV